jgi:hypothetical protein
MRSPKKIGRVKASASAGRNEKSKQEEVQILEYHALKSSIRNSAAVRYAWADCLLCVFVCVCVCVCVCV